MPNVYCKAFDMNGHSIWAIKEIVLSKKTDNSVAQGNNMKINVDTSKLMDEESHI